MTFQVREYRPADEDGWLRCRVLSFMYTTYFDDVRTRRTPGIDLALVAEDAGAIVGLIDVAIEDDKATIDSIAVHPDHARRGIGTALLAAAESRLDGCTELDAWTREDAAALNWYRRSGFTEDSHYVHAYAVNDEAIRTFERVNGMRPMRVFAHAKLSEEQRLRAEYKRVYVCRRFAKPLG